MSIAFSIPSSLTVAGSLTVSPLQSVLARTDSNGLVTGAMFSGLAFTNGVISVSGASNTVAGSVRLAGNTLTASGIDTGSAVVAAGLKYTLDPQMAGREGSDYLYCDGVTTNRSIVTQYGTTGAMAGSDMTEVDYVFDVPTSNPSAEMWIFHWSTSSAPGNEGTTNALMCAVDTNGMLRIRENGTGANDYRIWYYTGWRAAYSGRRVRLTVAFTGNSTTAPVVWQDGVDISASFALSSNDSGGGIPNWMHTALGTTYHLRGFYWGAGYFRPGRPVNRKYAQADVDYVQSTSRLPFADAQGGSAVSLVTGDASTFASDTGWSMDPSSNISGGKLNQTGGSWALPSGAGTMVPGRRYRFAVTVDSLTAGNYAYYNGVAYVTFATTSGTYTVDFVALAATSFYIAPFGGNGVVDNFTFYTVGALSNPVIQPTGSITDSTSNNISSTLTGFTAVSRNNATQRFGRNIEVTDAPTESNAVYRKRDVDAMVGSRVGEDYLQSDGATTVRRVEAMYGLVGAVAGSDLTFVDFIFDVPTSNPSSTIAICSFGPSNSVVSSSSANALGVLIGTGGDLIIRQTGATISDWRQVLFTGWRASYTGRRVRLTVAFTGGSTTDPTVYQDGVVLNSGSSGTLGTAPNWVSSSLDTTYCIAGFNWPAGYFRPGRPVNRKYTQTDVDFVQTTGKLPYADAAGGSMVATYTSDFSSSVDSWDNSGLTGSVVTGNIDSIGGEDNWLRATNSSGGLLTLIAARGTIFTVGQRYRVRLKVYVPSTITAATHIGFGSAGVVLSQVATESKYIVACTQDTVQTLEGDIIASNTGMQVKICTGLTGAGANAADGLSFYMKEVTVKPVGALSDPVIQPAYVLDDATGNGICSALVGFTPVTGRTNGRIRGTLTWAGTHEAKLLLGSGGGLLYPNSVIQAITSKATVASSGVGIVISTNTTTARWVAANSYTTAKKAHTIANVLPLGTASGDTDIRVDPDNANYTGSITVDFIFVVTGGNP